MHNGEEIGTRIQHIMELQKLWSDVLGILTAPNTYHLEAEKIRAKEITTALDLLQHYLEEEYDPTAYAIEINKLPKPPQEKK